MIAEARKRSEQSGYRWVTLAVLLIATAIVILDNTVLNVAIPTLLRDFDTSLPALQWVISGYSLTFATLLIIGGKLGDVYGARRTFMVGLAIFGVGSLIASMAHSVGQMIVGEAIVEGIGASLLLPAATGIMTNTFRGRERATAYAMWGTVVGASAAFGPLVGGYLTTYHSWRWAFRINVILAPVAIVAALLLMRRDGARRQVRFDVIGALLVAVASFCLVFGLSQGPTYGWWKPLTTLTVNGHEVWARGRSISIIPFMLVVAIVVAFTFLRVERWKEARDGESLFPLSQLEHRGFRNGIVTALMFTLGAFGFMFVLPVFLQQGKHLDAMHAGLWLVAYGLTVLVGAQIAGSLAPRIGPVVVVRLGICVSIAGTLAMVFTLSSSVTFLQLLPCMVLCGIGAGFVNTQLSNVILFDVDREHAGVAAASASTVRQLGAAFGIAVIGTVLSTASRNSALSAVRHAPLAADARARLLDEIRRKGMTITGDRSVPTALLPRLEEAVAHGARVAFLLAVVALVAAQLPAWRIPRRAGHVDALLEGAADERPEIIPTVPAEVS